MAVRSRSIQGGVLSPRNEGDGPASEPLLDAPAQGENGEPRRREEGEVGEEECVRDGKMTFKCSCSKCLSLVENRIDFFMLGRLTGRRGHQPYLEQ
eukprot:766742-Hanusia_phi.AAC.1